MSKTLPDKSGLHDQWQVALGFNDTGFGGSLGDVAIIGVTDIDGSVTTDSIMIICITIQILGHMRVDTYGTPKSVRMPCRKWSLHLSGQRGCLSQKVRSRRVDYK